MNRQTPYAETNHTTPSPNIEGGGGVMPHSVFNIIEKRSPKEQGVLYQRGATMDANSTTKRFRNQCTKKVPKRRRNIMRTHVFLMGRIMQIHHTVVKCANRKLIKQTSKMIPKSIPKSMNNQCNINPRRNHATNIRFPQTNQTKEPRKATYLEQSHPKPFENRCCKQMHKLVRLCGPQQYE